MISQKVKGICSLVGAVFALFVSGSLYAWGAMVGYYASYLRKNGDPEITVLDIFFVMPISALFYNLFLGMSSYIHHKLNSRIMALMSIVGIVIAHVILIFNTSLYVSYLAMLIFGVSVSFFFLPSLHNLWLYFPNRKGLISGIVLCSFGFSASIINILAAKVINPDMKPADDHGLFPDDVADNFKTFLVVITITFSVIGTFAVLLTFPYTNETIVGMDSKQEKLTGVTPDEEPIKRAFTSTSFILVCILCFSTTFYPYMVSNTSKTFGEINKLSQSLLTTMMICFSFLNGGLRVFWGFLLDKFSFKILYSIIVTVGLVSSSGIYFIAQNEVIYFIFVILAAVTMSGHTALMPASSPKLFGIKNASIVYGVCTINTGVAAFLGAIIARFTVKSKEDYMILYLIGAGLNIVSLIVLYFLKPEKIDYSTPSSKESTKISNSINNLDASTQPSA